jgi:putative ABC transport system permease protein
VDSLLQDLRYALRGLLRTPGFTLAVIATLALGIGANTTMFGVLDTLLLKPPAQVHDASRIVRVYFKANYFGQTVVNPGASFPGYESLVTARGFSAVAAVAGGQVSIGDGPAAREAKVVAVSASFFPLLGVTPERGRFFDSTEDRLGAGPVAVVSHRYWMREMTGDPAAVGRTLRIGQFAYTVIGVAPPGFAGADLEAPDLWLPIQQAAPLLASAEALQYRGWFWLSILARLAPGVSPAAATAEADLAYRRAAAASDRARDTLNAVVLGPIQAARGPEMSSDAKVALWVGLVAFAVLLVACANVANLLLARGMRRRAEVAVRAGLGASRGRLVRQLMVESLVLALAGGAAGLLVALWGGAVVRAFLLPHGVTAGSIVDPRVLGFTGAAAVVVAALAGGAPAWQASRADLASALRSGSRDIAAGRGLLRSSLLATQVALTLVLLVGAGLFLRSLRHAETLDYGFDLGRLLGARAELNGSGAPVQITSNDAGPGGEVVDAQSALYLRLVERLRPDPAVASVAASAGSPFESVYGIRGRASGRDSLPRVASGGPYVVAVTPGYFATLGTRILRGRGFTGADTRGALPVAVVSRTFARLVWPDREAIGECLYLGAGGDSTCVQVVGVAADMRAQASDVTGDAPMTYYVPFAQRLARIPLDGLLIRTRGPAAAVQGEIQHTLQGAVPGLPYVSVQSMLDRVAPLWRSWRLGATMLSVFGLLALVIASLGLYGVTAYGVTQRTREIGLRIALGAGDAGVVRLAVTQAVRATAVGALIGLGIALALARALASLLFGVKPLDPASLGGAVVVLLAVAALAAYLPARRAARVDPMEALRTE